MELEKIVNDLESNQTQDCEEAKRKLGEFFTQNKEQWVVQGMMDYFLKTGSLRIGEVLIKVQAPHDTHIFDRLSEWIKLPTHRLPAINFFSFVVRRHPTWLHKVEKHRLIKEIFKLLQTEKEIVPFMSALLCIITLLPIIPNAVSNFLDDLFAVFSYLALWNWENAVRLKDDDRLVHMQLGLQMLFHRLYGMFPCNFLEYLKDFIKKDQKCAIYQHIIKPLLATVSIHPLLLTATVTTETSSTRWKEMEPHDVVVECAEVTLPVLHQDFNVEAVQQLPAIHEYSVPDTPILALPSNVPQLVHSMHTTTTTHQTTSQTVSWFGTPLDTQYKRLQKKPTAEFTRLETQRQRSQEENSNNANSGSIWSPLYELTANTGPIPLTPTPNYMLPMVTPNAANVSHQLLGITGSSPPEAAVEATPETTPMKDMKIATTVTAVMTGGPTAASGAAIGNPNAVRAIFASSQPSSPMRKDPNHFNFPEAAAVTTDFMRSDDGMIRQQQSAYLEQELSKRTFISRDRGYDKMTEQQHHSRSNIEQTIETQAIAATRRNFSPVDVNFKSGTPDMDSEAFTIKSELWNANRIHTHTPTQIQTPTPLENITRACHECNETDLAVCTAGGLQMPDRAMKMLLTGIKRRNRMVSCSYNEHEKSSDFKRNTENDLMDDKVKVRRTKSCSSISLANTTALSEPAALLKNEKNFLHGPESAAACRLQKSGKMLAIATTANKTTTISNERRSNAACQTIESAVTSNYENSLFKMLCEERDLRRQYESKLRNPQQLLDQFIIKSVSSYNTKPDQEIFQLMNLQLQYERYRREIHAERNRRLMGRNRTKRSLEMERDRIREQLNSFAANNENLLKQNDATIKAANEREQRLNEEIMALKLRYRNEVEQNKCLKEAMENLQTRLTEQLSSRKDIDFELETLRGQIFNLNTELEQAQLQVDVGNQCKQELARLEAEVIIMGEIQVRCRDQLLEMENCKAREEEMQKFREVYNMELRDIKLKLEEKISQLDSAKYKIIEMQTQLVNCEKENTELKRLLRTVKNEYEERFKALTYKYENQKIILMQMEEKVVSFNRPYTTQGACSPDADKTDVASSMERNSPLSTSLASSESLSTSLRSTEFRNLQQLAESNSAIVAQDIGRSLPLGPDFDGPSVSNSGAASSSSNEQKR